jgi:hypothetical protein
MAEACRLNAMDPKFLLFAVPRGISFKQLQELSVANFGTDLSRFNTFSIRSARLLHPSVEKVARQVMARRLADASGIGPRAAVSIQINTRERLPVEGDEVLIVDACHLFESGAGWPEGWDRLLAGLRDIKAELSSALGRPLVLVNGSKHLCAAFLIGRVFSPFDLQIRQTKDDVWASNCKPAAENPFKVELEDCGRRSGTLVVDVASGLKNLKAGIEAMPDSPAASCAIHLSLRPEQPLTVDNPLCAAMARQAYLEIELAIARGNVSQIHLFAAAPGSFMAFLGRQFRGMPETVLYEWEEGRYIRAATVPGSVL